MLKIFSGVCAAAMVLTLPMAAPVLAMPLQAPAAPGLVTQVQSGQPIPELSGQAPPGMMRDLRGRNNTPRADSSREYRGDRDRNRSERRAERRGDRDRAERRADRRDHRRHDRVERRGDRHYYRGHRGYRDPRPGYRQYQGWWFPPAAFIAGAIVGGAINDQPRVREVPVNAHVDWCYSRYRSYREYDNTFQPYNGPRRQCISPYS